MLCIVIPGTSDNESLIYTTDEFYDYDRCSSATFLMQRYNQTTWYQHQVLKKCIVIIPFCSGMGATNFNLWVSTLMTITLSQTDCYEALISWAGIPHHNYNKEQVSSLPPVTFAMWDVADLLTEYPCQTTLLLTLSDGEDSSSANIEKTQPGHYNTSLTWHDHYTFAGMQYLIFQLTIYPS